MAVLIGTDLVTLYDGNTAFGGGTVYSGFQRFGTGCNGSNVSAATSHFVGTVTSFSLIGKQIFSWMIGPGSIGTIAQGGYRIVIGDGTNQRAYFVGGTDAAAFFVAGWFCFTLNGDNLPTQFEQLAGSAQPNLAAITQVGVGFTNVSKSTGNSPNCFFDVARVGTGLEVYGGSNVDPGTFDDIANADLSTANAWGVFRRIDAGVYGSQGRLTFGRVTGQENVFRQQDALLFFEGIPVGPTFYQIGFNGGSASEFTLGTKIGSGESAIGSAGVTIQSVRPWSFTAGIGSVDLYGCTLRGADNGVNLGSNNEFISSIIDASGQVIANNTVIRNSTFSGYLGTTGALRWNNLINIQNSSFTGNARAIQHIEAGEFTYTGLTFAGNTFDVNNASGGSLIVNAAAGTNASSFENSAGGSTVINNAVSLTLTDIITDSEVRIYSTGTTTELAGIESVVGSSFQYTYNYVANTFVDIVVHKEEYVYYRVNNFLLPATDASLPIAQRLDRNYLNP